jgi:hypothetical protein
MNEAFVKALKKARMLNRSEFTGRKTMAVHGLRRYFATQAKMKISPALVEFLMGHAGPEAGAYDGWTENQLAKEYVKAEPALLVNASAEKLEGLENLETINNTLMSELKDLKERMAQSEAFNRRFMNVSTEQLAEIGRRVLKAQIAESGHIDMGSD